VCQGFLDKTKTSYSQVIGFIFFAAVLLALLAASFNPLFKAPLPAESAISLPMSLSRLDSHLTSYQGLFGYFCSRPSSHSANPDFFCDNHPSTKITAGPLPEERGQALYA